MRPASDPWADSRTVNGVTCNLYGEFAFSYNSNNRDCICADATTTSCGGGFDAGWQVYSATGPVGTSHLCQSPVQGPPFGPNYQTCVDAGYASYLPDARDCARYAWDVGATWVGVIDDSTKHVGCHWMFGVNEVRYNEHPTGTPGGSLVYGHIVCCAAGSPGRRLSAPDYFPLHFYELPVAAGFYWGAVGASCTDTCTDVAFAAQSAVVCEYEASVAAFEPQDGTSNTADNFFRPMWQEANAHLLETPPLGGRDAEEHDCEDADDPNDFYGTVGYGMMASRPHDIVIVNPDVGRFHKCYRHSDPDNAAEASRFSCDATTTSAARLCYCSEAHDAGDFGLIRPVDVTDWTRKGSTGQPRRTGRTTPTAPGLRTIGPAALRKRAHARRQPQHLLERAAVHAGRRRHWLLQRRLRPGRDDERVRRAVRAGRSRKANPEHVEWYSCTGQLQETCNVLVDDQTSVPRQDHIGMQMGLRARARLAAVLQIRVAPWGNNNPPYISEVRVRLGGALDQVSSICEDGGDGAEYSVCEWGTDCADCGEPLADAPDPSASSATAPAPTRPPPTAPRTRR